MMKLLKKSFLIPTCLTLLTASSQAALVLEFREVGGTQVELSFSGSVDVADSFFGDLLNVGSNLITVFGGGGISYTPGGSSNPFEHSDIYSGVDLFSERLNAGADLSINESIGFYLVNEQLIIGNGLVSHVLDDGVGNIGVLSAYVGGGLFGKTQTFDTTFSESRLGRFEGSGLQDLWRVSGTTGTDNLIQFRVNPSSVPEPSSILMGCLGLLTLATKRKRKA